MDPARERPLAKLRVLSTHLFVNQRLNPELLELAGQSGAQAVEIFAARQHFDYLSHDQVTELATWFRSNPLEAWSMHAPLYSEAGMGRAGAPSLNLLNPEKLRRIEAMDEIKRALETADSIPFRKMVVHLGERDDEWSPRSVEYAITALEHLGAFARPLGVQPLVENLTGEPTTPRASGGDSDCRPPGFDRRLPRPRPRSHDGRHPRGHRHIWRAHRSGPRARQPRPQG